MRKFIAWWKKTGLENGFVGIAAFVFLFYIRGQWGFGIGMLLLGAFIGMNYQALKDLTTLDEKIETLVDEKLEEIKRLIGKD